MSARWICCVAAAAAALLTGTGVSAAPHRIQVRQGANGGEFYDTTTNQKFVPRGNNYIRLAPQGPQQGLYHSTFDPGRYDASRADAALGQMQHDGYNLVRVFLNESEIGNPAGGLSQAYLANLVDFLNKAKAKGIYTQITLPYLPWVGGYITPIANSAQISEDNKWYLTPEMLDGKKRYVRDLITGLQGLNAPLDYVFSYNIDNEIFWWEDQKPLSLSSGMVTTTMGAFNMADPAQRQHLMDANIIWWIDEVRAAAKAVDPTALVAPGFFSPTVVTGADKRITRSYWAIVDPAVGGSSADFVDLHLYPTSQSMAAEIAGFEIASNKKPLILGEFGAFKNLYPDIVSAAYWMRDVQIATCGQYGFDGWAFWAWDMTEQTGTWNAVDVNGAINGQLAPIVRPNPCQ